LIKTNIFRSLFIQWCQCKFTEKIMHLETYLVRVLIILKCNQVSFIGFYFKKKFYMV
jgi:hypothetical protein